MKKTPDMSTDPRLAGMEIIRQRLCAETEILDGGGAVVPGPTGDELVASMQADGSWTDVDYADIDQINWAAAQHLSRLQTLARGWFQPGSPLHQRQPVLQAILRGLDCWYVRNPQNPNWWWNQIGVPTLLGTTLLYVKGACARSYIERAVPAFECHKSAHGFTGQNLVWVANIRILHGLLTDEPERVSDGHILIGREVRVFPDDEGIQPDMSFHQHGKLLYSGGYGQGFAADVARVMAFASGTVFAWPPKLVNRFAGYLLDGSRWMVRGRTFDPSACGREVARPGHSARRFHAGLRHLASFEHARQAEAQAALAVDPASGESLVTGAKYFWCSDFMVQHGGDGRYYLSVRMRSRRLLTADMICGGREGRLCHHLSDGFTCLLSDGDEYRDIYPVWNWRQIPGTTVVQDTGELDLESLRGFGERSFVGGASDGVVGCAAMDFARGELTARKAWFLFDEEMVALGAGICATAAAPVRTTINQCHWRGPALLLGHEGPLAAGEYPLAAGAAFWQDGVTYRIFDGTGTLRFGPQSGSWRDCGVGSPERLTLNVMNAGLDHGVRPQGATYAYAVQPDVHECDAFADSPKRIEILSNTPALQAVWHATFGRGFAVFYEPGSVWFCDGQRVSVDRPCILLYNPRRDGTVVFTVAQPEQKDGIVTLTLDKLLDGTLGISLPGGTQAGSSQTLVVGSPKTAG